MQIQSVTLIGSLVRLEPLAVAHVADLTRIGCDEQIWRFMVYGDIKTEQDMHRWVLELLDGQSKGTDLPFAVIYKESGAAIGVTRYLSISPPDRSIEIGGTWYGLDFQRTGVNTECKYLLLQHAFEILNCIRVQLKTDARNLASQRAIERLGAVKEGVLRKHMILPDGTQRDSVVYSIIDTEWPRVKAHLQQLMGKYQ